MRQAHKAGIHHERTKVIWDRVMKNGEWEGWVKCTRCRGLGRRTDSLTGKMEPCKICAGYGFLKKD